MRTCVLVVLMLLGLGVGCADGDTETADQAANEATSGSDDEWRSVRVQSFTTPSEATLELVLAYCGDNYRVSVDEHERTVEVLAETADPAEPPAPDCATVAETSLDLPLGDREVIDIRTDLPVPRR